MKVNRTDEDGRTTAKSKERAARKKRKGLSYHTTLDFHGRKAQKNLDSIRNGDHDKRGLSTKEGGCRPVLPHLKGNWDGLAGKGEEGDLKTAIR